MKADSEAQVVEAVREARAARHTLEIASGGTRRGFGRPMRCDEMLDLSGLSGIVNYEPEELVLTVKPGTPLAEIDAALSAKGQRLGFEPQDWRALLGSTGTPTIAGAISSGADGSAAIRFGRARDHLLGFRAVNGFGEAYKGGGRVVKNVTGFDLPKLMCGAMGTLGPLTELTFRVFPKARIVRHFAVRGLEDREAFALLRRAWSSPLDATGLAHMRGTTLIRLEGTSVSLAEKTAMLHTLAPCDLVEDDGAAFARIVAFEDTASDVWRIDMPPSQAADFPAAGASDWAGARRWVLAAPGRTRVPGRAVLVRASEAARRETPIFPVPDAALERLTRAVKAAFDPLGLFNPARMGV
jgi:glycolate oxidase FAD binding subunit